MPIIKPLTAAQAARFHTASRCLQQGQHAEALRLARALVVEAAQTADAQQLLGMCLASQGEQQEAETAFRKALKLAPASEAIILNVSAWLRQRERLPEAAELLATGPDTGAIKVQQGLLALRMNDLALAFSTLHRAVALQPDAATAWHGLGNAARGLDDLDTAEQAFRQLLSLVPGHTAGWINLGMVLRLQGRLNEGLDCLMRAQALGHSGPELADALNGLRVEMGQVQQGLEGARALVASHPGFVQAHETLARLLWEHGPRLAPAQEPLAALCAAVSQQPGHHALRQMAVSLLLSAHRAGEALALMQDGPQPGTPLSDWQWAEVLGANGQHQQAHALYARVHDALGDSSGDFLNAYARHALTTGRIELAERCAASAVARDARNQEAWSHLGTAWRLLGDAREHWLCDYERLVGCVEVPAPAGFDGQQDFLSALGLVLNGLHTAGHEPIDQSVRHGSQTTGRLFGRHDPTLAATHAALLQATSRWLATLPDDASHPFLARKQETLRMVGSWSVKLWSSGHHSNHIHPKGWLSSAFYVALPTSVQQATAAQPAGWLQFGQPQNSLGLQLPPRRLLQPRPGYLALFPSYLWHGTLPFDDPQPRLTVAFDLQGAGKTISLSR